MNEIELAVIEILENMGTDKIDDFSLKLTDDLGLDSLKMVTLLILLEDTFYIELDESDMNPFDLITVKDVIDLATEYVIQQEGDSI